MRPILYTNGYTLQSIMERDPDNVDATVKVVKKRVVKKKVKTIVDDSLNTLSTLETVIPVMVETKPKAVCKPRVTKAKKAIDLPVVSNVPCSESNVHVELASISSDAEAQHITDSNPFEENESTVLDSQKTTLDISCYDFELFKASDNPDIPVTLPISTKMQEIKTPNSKRIWTILGPCSVKYGFASNQYKSNNTTDGHVVFAVNECDKLCIDTIDEKVGIAVLGGENFKIVNNIKMTTRTWQSMYRSSSYNGDMRIKASRGMVAFFSSDKQLLKEQVGWDNLLSGVSITCVVEPVYLWFMDLNDKKQAGTSWILRQVRFLEDIVATIDTGEEEWTMAHED